MKKPLRCLSLLTVALACQSVVSRNALAQQALPSTPPNVQLPQDQAATNAAIDNCLRLIRRCQLGDGAFRMKAEGNPIWIRPYFGDYAALALLVAGKPEDVPRVAGWLTWYAKHQLPDGTINDFEGGLAGGYRDNGQRDSVDAYAATFLLVAERYYRAQKTLPAGVKEAMKKAVAAIQSVVDPKDGLTWARADYPIKFLQDNVVTYGGLVAAERLFTAQGDMASATTTQKMAEAIGTQLPKYLRQDDKGKTFAYALDGAGDYQLSGPNYLETQGMANIFGLAWVSDANKSIWGTRFQGMKPDGGVAPEAPLERWYIAALHADKDPDAWRQATVRQARAFVFNGFDTANKQNDVYIHRPAIAVLALLEGSKWLPSIMDSTPQ